MKRSIALNAFVALFFVGSAAAQFKIPGVPIEIPVEIPGTSDTSESTSSGTKVAGAGAGCAMFGAAGYFGAKALDGFLREQGYSGAEVEQAALLAAGAGCVIGGAAALAIIENMDEKSKAAQDEAWEQAQADASGTPVNWEGPQGSDYSGTVTAEAPEQMADGKTCITRRNYVETSSGDATSLQRYCKTPGGEYVEVDYT